MSLPYVSIDCMHFCIFSFNGWILWWLEYIADSCIWWGNSRGVQSFIAND